MKTNTREKTGVSRRLAMGIFAQAAAGAVLGDWMSPAHAKADGLASLAGERGLLFGSAIAMPAFKTAYADLFVRETSIIVPENDMKMGNIRKHQQTADFTRADAIFDFARKNYLAIRGHTLVWNSWVPEWVKKLNKVEMERFLDEYIDLVMGRYRGHIHSWDVVNEAIGHDRHGALTLRGGPFTEVIGPDYIARSFRRARAADPKAKLILNETHTERDDELGRSFRARLLTLIDHLLDAGVPLDGVGLQGHIQPDVNFIPDRYAEFLKQISDRGLEIQITELDVNDQSFPDDIQQRDALVADTYSRFLKCVLENEMVKAVLTWQMMDGAAYYYNESLYKLPAATRRPRPLLFDLQLNRKPSYYAVARAFREIPQRA